MCRVVSHSVLTLVDIYFWCTTLLVAKGTTADGLLTDLLEILIQLTAQPLGGRPVSHRCYMRVALVIHLHLARDDTLPREGVHKL